MKEDLGFSIPELMFHPEQLSVYPGFAPGGKDMSVLFPFLPQKAPPHMLA